MHFSKPFLISLFVLIFSFEAQAAALGKVMLLGDSVTHAAGGSDKEGYRYELWKKLVTNGYMFDFVGSHDTYFSEPNYTPPSVNGNAFDKDHEGHSSYSTKDILGTVPENASSNNIDSWLGSYTPDTAFIQLGLNDIFQGMVNNSADITNWAQDTANGLETIISKIKSDNNNVNIFVGTLYKYSFSDWDFAINPTETQQEEMWNSLNNILNGTFGSDNGVTVVELNTGFINPLDPNHLYDGLHPGPAGEQFIADQFYNAAVAPVPVPAAVWLFGSALVGLVGISRKSKVVVSDSV